MVTVIVKRTDEPNVIQLTQELIMKELSQLNGSEMLLEDSWSEGLRKVRTPYVCLVEPDCTPGEGFIASSLKQLHKNSKGKLGRGAGGGGYTKLAMLTPTLGVKIFSDCIYGYELRVADGKVGVVPSRKRKSKVPFHVQVGFVPGALIRYGSIKEILNLFDWDGNPVQLSVELSLHLWDTNRRIQLNPAVEYVSNSSGLDKFKPFPISVSPQVNILFGRDFDILNNPKVSHV